MIATRIVPVSSRTGLSLSRKARGFVLLTFLMLFDALVRPFMSAMGAFVVVLKFLHVDNHWNSWATYITTPTTNPTTRPAQLSSAFLSFHMNKLLALNLYVKSTSTSGAESEKLRFKSTVSVDSMRIRPLAGSQDEEWGTR
jgi:hypothetical protein